MGFSWLLKRHPKHTIVDHIDGNSLNNSIYNLRWVTNSGNNLNRAGYGLVKDDSGLFVPKILGYLHTRYATDDEELAQKIRTMLLDCYIRYNTRFPEKKCWPHNKIHKF